MIFLPQSISDLIQAVLEELPLKTEITEWKYHKYFHSVSLNTLFNFCRNCRRAILGKFARLFF